MTVIFRENIQDMIVKCDYSGCKDSQMIRSKTFIAGIIKIKAKGWSVKKIDDEWNHFCPICRHYV